MTRQLVYEAVEKAVESFLEGTEDCPTPLIKHAIKKGEIMISEIVEAFKSTLITRLKEI